jgi:hypothetical protein
VTDKSEEETALTPETETGIHLLLNGLKDYSPNYLEHQEVAIRYTDVMYIQNHKETYCHYVVSATDSSVKL